MTKACQSFRFQEIMDKIGRTGIKAIAFFYGYAYASSLIVSAIALLYYIKPSTSKV
ncbi:MAG TPA: hypothetical protein V6D15_25675 [Oculatellaceae cyanobacterium]|jgi:hypothetical protein